MKDIALVAVDVKSNIKRTGSVESVFLEFYYLTNTLFTWIGFGVLALLKYVNAPIIISAATPQQVKSFKIGLIFRFIICPP